MFALASPICSRLTALSALSGWQVRNSAEEVSRAVYPAIEVGNAAAGSADRGAAALVVVQWSVDLMDTRAAGATDVLDTAFKAVVGSLHNWKPGTHGGVPWMRLYLKNVQPAEIADQGLVGYTLVFETSATYDGQKP